jgi:hypothetical protein
VRARVRGGDEGGDDAATVERVFKMTPPDGGPFHAAVVKMRSEKLASIAHSTFASE